MKQVEYTSPTLAIVTLAEDAIRTSTEVWDTQRKEWVDGDLDW